MPIAPEYLHLIYPGEMTAFVYGRNSRDPLKQGTSVADQVDSGRELCDEHGWPVVDVFDQDVGKSASRYARKKRSDFEAMLAGIEAGKCRIVVAFEASRYYRDLEMYLQLRNACMSAGVLLCYNGQVYDLSKREDRRATAQDALQAEDEADGIRDRVLRTTRAQAKKGVPHGRILFGYARRYDPDTGVLIEQYPHPENSLVVREVYERVAAGETVYAIVRSFNDRGIRTQQGCVWQEHHVSSMLRNPGYIGQRVHQGKVVGDATWPAIVDEATYYAVQRIVRAPSRLTVRDRSVKHLLSGIALCGVCDDGQVLRIVKDRGRKQYSCPRRFHVGMAEPKLDAYVEEAVISWLSSDGASEVFRTEPADSAAKTARLRHENLTAQLEEAREAAARFRPDGRPELSVSSLAALEAQLEPQIEEARSQAEAVSVPPILRRFIGASDADAAWSGLEVPQKRTVLRSIVTIRLHTARNRGVRSIEPGRVGLDWVGQPGFVSTQ